MNYLLSALKMSSNDADSDDLYNSQDSSSLASALKMQVILRIRPANPPPRNKNQADAYLVENPTSLLVRNFSSSDSARRGKITGDNQQTFRKFTFHQIFNLKIDQAQFFDEAIRPAVIDFLSSQDSSVISYGSADAGKTYTLFGHVDDAGIIPRSICFIFSSINFTTCPRWKPVPSQFVVPLEETEQELERQNREKLLASRSIDKSACEAAYTALLDFCQPDDNFFAHEDSIFSLWISFVEIYNDTVSDLLSVDEEGKSAPLKLSSDKQGSTYVQGAQSVCATTGLEAYEILNAGQMRLSTVSASNYKSSRSHSIFTMRLLKYDKHSSASAVQVSTMSFYDLAGSGKMQKSASSDKQLKESRSINTSLLAFGRCLKALAVGHSRQSTGPFRDSKLTRLFQHSLRKENLIILVNLNPSLELFPETQNVLNFASTAMKLTSNFAKEDKRLLDYPSPMPSPKLQETRSLSTAASRTLREQEVNEIVAKNKQLLDQIKDLKAAELSKEYKIRQDLADFYTKQLNDLEEIWRSRMSVAEDEKELLVQLSSDKSENYYKAQLSEHVKRKRKAVDKGSITDTSLSNGQSASKVLELEQFLKSVEEENEKLSSRNNRYASEVAWLNNHLQRITNYIWSDEKSDGELTIDNFPSKTFQYLNNDAILHVQSIIAFVKESQVEKQITSTFHQSNLSTKAVQYDSMFTLLNHHCEGIEELFHPNNISLPQINDSLCLLGDIEQNEPSDYKSEMENLIGCLSRIKESVAECLSNQKDLEQENVEKEEESSVLRRKIELQDIDISHLREQLAEAESAQTILLKKCESLEMACKSREFFKNPEFDAVESENSLSCALHREINSLERTNDSCQLSTLDLNSMNAESNTTTSSLDTSKNDSGVALSLDPVVKDDKKCQTDIQSSEDQNVMLRDKLRELNVDYNRMETQHLQGSKRITELSEELERIGEAMVQLKENTYAKDRAVSEYQSKLNDNEMEIERLNIEKGELEEKLDELQDNLLEVSNDYERKLAETQVKLKAYEEGEQKAARRLKDYWEKSVNLGSELSTAYSELDKCSIRCYKEHVLKISKLEEELNEKKLNLTNLNERMILHEKDVAEMITLSIKVDEFEELLIRLQKEKIELEKILGSKTETQLTIQNQLQNLTEKIGDRDNQILSLKWQLDTIIKANLSNSRKAKELGKEVTKLVEKMHTMKEDISESEAARIDLEKKSTKEIDNLRARLTVFEGNADLLNLIRNSDESKQCEMEKLKLKVLEKEKELDFFKKNRNATIQRYECLVKQLQNALKMNNSPDRMKKVLPHKERYCFNQLRETTSCYIRGSDSQMYNWKSDAKNSYLLPCTDLRVLEVTSKRDCERPLATNVPSESDFEARSQNVSVTSVNQEFNRLPVCLKSSPDDNCGGLFN